MEEVDDEGVDRNVPGFEKPSLMPSAEILKLTDQETCDLITYLLSLK